MSAPLAAWPSAPTSPVSPSGEPAFGAYAGMIDAVGWQRLAGASARGWLYRLLHHKRWHYASVVSERAVLAVAVIDVGLASSTFFYVFDRTSRRLLCDVSVVGPPGRARVSTAPGADASTRFRHGGANIALERPPGTSRWELRLEHPDVSLHASLEGAAAPPTLCAIARIGDGGLANCTHKTVGLPVTGRVTVGGTSIDLAGGVGALDHTDGLLARDTRWRWASATGPAVSFNLVEGFNGPIENVLWIGDRMVPIGQVAFTVPRPDTTRPWRVRSLDGRLELAFEPEGERRQDKNLVVLRSTYVQPFGRFLGTFRDGDAVIPIDVGGVTEDHVAIW